LNYTTTKNYKKFIYYAVITIIWLSFIFYNSSLNGIKSTVESNSYTYILAKLINRFTGGDIYSLQKSLTFFVRKCAHFTSYFILMVFCFLALKNIIADKKYLIISAILFCIYAAATDEFIQLFSDGRSGNLIDVLIDTLGNLSAIFLIGIINNLNKHKNAYL